MRNARFTGWGAAAVATVLVATAAAPATALTIAEPVPSAAPSPAENAAPQPTASPEPTPAESPVPAPEESPEPAAPVQEATPQPVRTGPSTGDLTVTRFDDRYADGLYDPSKTARDESTDAKRTFGYAFLRASDGAWYGANAGPEGDFAFRDIPVGEAKVYLAQPNTPLSAVFFDATDATSADDIERLPNQAISVTGATFQNADGSTGTINSPTNILHGEAPVTVDEDGEELLVGMTSLRAGAEVADEEGNAVSGVAVEFASGDVWYPATEEFGSYEAFNDDGAVRHIPDELGLRLTPPAGYSVAEVTVEDGEVDVEERDGAFWLNTVSSPTYSSSNVFQVTLEKKPTASLEVTYFADVTLDGVYTPATDKPFPGASVYLKDSAGDWFATSADAEGQYSFPGVAPGEAQIYVGIPEIETPPSSPQVPELEFPESALAVWDASDITSYRETVRADTSKISFTGTRIDPATGTSEPITVTDELVGEISADLELAGESEAPQQVLVGGATVTQIAIAADPTSQSPVEGVELEFFANGERIEGTELSEAPGAFIPTEENGDLAIFGAAEYGIRLTAPKGYKVAEVAAVNARGDVLVVNGAPSPGKGLFAVENEYRVTPEQVGGPASAIIWAVQLASTTPTEPTDPVTPTEPTEPGAGPVVPGAPAPSAPAPSTASTDRLAATGSSTDLWAWMLAATLLIAAGLGTRLVTRRRSA